MITSRIFWFALGGVAAYYVFVVKKAQVGPLGLEGTSIPWASIYPESSARECYAFATMPTSDGRRTKRCFDRCKQSFAPPAFCLDD